MQSRRIARELALMGMSQLSDRAHPRSSNTSSDIDLDQPLKGAIATVTTEVKESLEAASAELTRAERHLLTSETRTDEPEVPRQQVQAVIDRVRTAVARLAYTEELPGSSVPTLIAEAKGLLETASTELTDCDSRLPYRPADEATNSPTRDAIALVQTAINRLGPAVELYQLVPVAQQPETLDYAGQILQYLTQHQSDLDTTLDDAMEGWKLKRLARVDRDILRIALTEILYLKLDKRIAIDEAVEVAKRYSDDDGYRFINGVMRRVTDRLKQAAAVPGPSPDRPPENPPSPSSPDF
ncbi:MAG: transcription antitermination factor NusB [Cyanobacteria bacterium J06632_22]